MQSTEQEINPDNGQKVQQHLTFLAGGEEYAVSLLKVAKITEYDTVTEVLQTWEWVRKMSRSSHKSAGKNAITVGKEK